MKAGVHPLNKNFGPSSLKDLMNTSKSLELSALCSTINVLTMGKDKIKLTTDISLDLITSKGAQMATKLMSTRHTRRKLFHSSLVATKPANTLAVQ